MSVSFISNYCVVQVNKIIGFAIFALIKTPDIPILIYLCVFDVVYNNEICVSCLSYEALNQNLNLYSAVLI